MQRVQLGNLLKIIQRAELAAVPDHAFPDHHDACGEHVFDILAEEGSLPRLFRHRAFRFDLFEDRRFLEVHSDVIDDGHQQEGELEWNAPSPCVECIIAEIGAGDDDDDQRQDSAVLPAGGSFRKT